MEYQSELYRLSRRTRSIGLSEGEASIFIEADDQQCCLRVIKNGRCGLVTHPDINDDNRSRLEQEAIALSAHLVPDLDRCFAQPLSEPLGSIVCDSSLCNHSQQDIIDMLEGVEKTILGVDKRITKVLRLELSEELSTKRIQNTLGLDVSTSATSVSVLGEILSSDGFSTESAWDMSHRRFFRDLNLHAWATQLGEEAVLNLGAKPIVSGAYPVLVHPRVGVQLLSLFSRALSAEAVQMGRSFLRDQINNSVASDVVTLIDDPLMPLGASSDSVDDEGTPHQPMSVLSKGVLTNYFYDLRTAKKAGLSSTGHGLKESISGHPSPQATNFYMAAGSQSLAELMNAHAEVFLLKDVMGLHMADPVTGEFSLGASGALLRQGKIDQAVRGVTIAGSLSQFLSCVDAVGSEIHWRGSFGCPYFLVSSLTVAGS